jgi:hypothetical protein
VVVKLRNFLLVKGCFIDITSVKFLQVSRGEVPAPVV